MSIRSLAADWTAWIFVQGLHIEPVTSSIKEISTLLPPEEFPVQALLGHRAAVAVLGGAVGAQLGSVYLSAAAICRVLAIVLLVAGLKLTLT